MVWILLGRPTVDLLTLDLGDLGTFYYDPYYVDLGLFKSWCRIVGERPGEHASFAHAARVLYDVTYG